MKHIHLTMLAVAVLTTGLFTSCKQKVQETDATLGVETVVEKPSLRFLKDLNGQYPKDAKVFENADFTQRLQELLGDRYEFLVATWNVESPIIISDNSFIANACQAHNCMETNFIIVYSFSKNVLYAGIRENNEVKTYSEDGSAHLQVAHWAEQNKKEAEE